MPDQIDPAVGLPTCYRHPDREAHIRCQRCDRVICPDCMRPAAVGFQCPGCVAEGARSTRAGRTAYGGLRPTNASITSGVLIAINVAVWLFVRASGGAGGRLFGILALSPVGRCHAEQAGFYYPRANEGICQTVPGTFWLPGVSEGAYWQLLTSMFTHEAPWHLGFNMLALWILGPQLEMMVGRVRFLALYLLSGLVGSAFVYWLAAESSATIGASGAIFGLMGALLVVALRIRGNVQGIFTWIALNFVLTFAIRGISWQGHLGGFLGGLACGALLVFAPRGPSRSVVQTTGLVLLAVLVAVAIVSRTAALA